MVDWVRSDLLPAYDREEQAVRAWCSRKGGDLDAPLAAEHRLLSPSDFGFHNCFVCQGKLRFFDFEYAGWDDPVKTVCDFFCQPSVPVPLTHFEPFAVSLLANSADPALELERAFLLLPLHRLKWCGILLNELLPIGARRRAFSGVAADREERLSLKLASARRSLRSISNSTPPSLTKD